MLIWYKTSMNAHLLLVDDDSLLRRSLAFSLEEAGYRTSTAATAEDALLQIKTDCPDLLLLDIGLPGMDGLQALRYFRDDAGIPVIFLTARDRHLDEVMGLELGAEDYITKPFDLDILLARIRVVLRRNRPVAVVSPTQKPMVVGDMVIDVAARTVTLDGREIELSAREFDLLQTLAQAAGQVVTVEHLLTAVWGAEFSGETQVVYVYIRWLRQKLETNPNHPKRIMTVRGVGYKLVPQER
jgi:DNA-binding response OmpR family regulator